MIEFYVITLLVAFIVFYCLVPKLIRQLTYSDRRRFEWTVYSWLISMLVMLMIFIFWPETY